MLPTSVMEQKDMLIREFYHSNKWFIFRWGKYQEEINGRFIRFIEISF